MSASKGNFLFYNIADLICCGQLIGFSYHFKNLPRLSLRILMSYQYLFFLMQPRFSRKIIIAIADFSLMPSQYFKKLTLAIRCCQRRLKMSQFR